MIRTVPRAAQLPSRSSPAPDDSARALLQRGRIIAFVVLLLLLGLQLGELLPLQARLRDFVFDGYQSLAPRERPSSPVMIVDIDEESLRRFGQWPWPRSLLARLVARVRGLGPAAIGLDILMPEPDGQSACALAGYVPDAPPDLTSRLCALPGNDTLLADELRRGPIALAVAGIGEPADRPVAAPPVLMAGGDSQPLLRTFAGALMSVDELQRAAPGHGLINGDADFGIVRRVPLAATVAGTVVPALSIELLRLASATASFTVARSGDRVRGVGVGDLLVPTQADGTLWIHYGRFRSDRYVSAARVLDGAVDPGVIERRVVLIGVSGLGLVDFPVNALGERVPGVDMHAQIIESIYDGTTLLRPRWAPWVEVAATATLGLTLIFGFASVTSLMAVGAALTMATALILGSFGLYVEQRLLVDGATPSLLVVLLLGGLLAYELMREQRQRRALEESLQQQREAAAVLAGEMAAARRIQLGMLPDVAAAFGAEARLDIAARMEAARDVGGDLYDCFMLDDHRVFLLLGDVCGKGIPASLFMATSKTLCKSAALRDGADLGRLLRQANREIARDNPEMLFVTAFAGILDLRNGELQYANAGHEPPFVAAPGRAPTRLAGDRGVPLGVLEDVDYAVGCRSLAGDEFLCAFTDGVYEATNVDDAVFGMERLAQVVGTRDGSDRSADVLHSLFAAVGAFAAGAEPSDDITVLVLRWNSQSAR